MTEKEKFVLNHYVITEDGKVFSNMNTRFHDTLTELKYRIDKDGYKDVSLVYNSKGDRQPFRVHRLVALKYIPNPNNYPVVNHKDLNKSNNHVSNLEWCTVAKNTQHGYNNGAYNSISKIEIILKSGEKLVFNTTSQASRYFGYANPTTIEHIVKANRIPSRGLLKGAIIRYIQ